MDRQTKRDRVEEMGLNRPGVMFEVGDCEFLTLDGIGPDGLRVRRLASGSFDMLDVHNLWSDHESGDLTTLGTYDRETESPVEDQHLEALVDAVKTLACDQDGFDDLDREQQGDLTAALNAVEEVLDQ